MKGGDFPGSSLLGPLRESLSATKALFLGGSRDQKAQIRTGCQQSVPLLESKKEVEEVMFSVQSPAFKTQGLRLYTCTYYFTEHSI